MSQLNDQQPKLRPFVHAGRLAVNHAFARPDQLIGATDEIALISMVAGG